MTSVVTTSLVVVVVLAFRFLLVTDEEAALVVEGVADVSTELEAEDVWMLDGALEVDDIAELEAEEVWALDETVDLVLEANELGADDVVGTTEEKVELDLELVTELGADVTTLDWELDDWDSVWLVETEVFELDGELEALLEIEELTDEGRLDDSVLE